MAWKTNTEMDCTKLFRLLSAAKEETARLQLNTVGQFTQMAIIQLVLDWDGLDPECIPDATLERIIDAKARMASHARRDNITVIHRQ